jgi:protoporphyrinogen oxidase
MAERCEVHFGCRVEAIEPAERTVRFSDGRKERYGSLVCTLPLNRTLELCGLARGIEADPFTSVLVLNIGARRGARCPADHWVYVPRSKSGFHRVGFYSNVDESFLPRSARGAGTHASLYVERSFPGGERPGAGEIADYSAKAAEELREWGFIDRVETMDPTWIDVAYTWKWPGSDWAERSVAYLGSVGIRMLGRYARWKFQGIAESIRDGLAPGAAKER